MNNFRPKIRVSQAQHAISDFFFKTGVFSSLFSSKPPSILTRNETFCEHKGGLLKFFGTMRLTWDLLQKFFWKKLDFIFFLFSAFLEGFRFRKFFLLFPVGEKWFHQGSRFMRIPSGIFWRCKIDEILTIMSFYRLFSVWYCLFGFLQKFATFFASVCEVRLRLCVNNHSVAKLKKTEREALWDFSTSILLQNTMLKNKGWHFSLTR